MSAVPAHLTAAQKLLWSELAPEFDLSLVSAQALLEVAVVALDRKRQAAAEVERVGMTIFTNNGKTAAQNPALKTEREMGAVVTRNLSVLRQRYPTKNAAANARAAGRETTTSPRVKRDRED